MHRENVENSQEHMDVACTQERDIELRQLVPILCRDWLASPGILQETSSPYNSSSNGLSEKGVQDVKNMMKRQRTRYDLSKLVAEANGMAKSGMDESPSNLFFNRTGRSAIPGSGRRMLDPAKAKEKRKEEQKSMRRQLGRGQLSLDTFQKGDRVRVQDPRKKTWRTTGTVMSTIHHEG